MYIKGYYSLFQNNLASIVTAMKTRWIGKNVDLNAVVDSIRRYFERKGFVVLVTKLNGKTSLIIKKSDPSLSITVELHGEPNDFFVDFKRGSQLRFTKQLYPFLFLLGAGSLVSRWMKKNEEYENIESEFWVFMNQLISELAGTI